MNMTMNTNKLSLMSAVGLLLAAAAVPATVANGQVDFAKQVRPIFAETCYNCHGPEKQKGELRLDSVEAINKGSEDGPVLVAGKPEESKLYTLTILPADHEDIMPAKGDPLTKEQQDLIAAWIKEGATFGDWKADEAVVDPSTVEAPLPEVPVADTAAVEALQTAGALCLPLAQDTNLLDVSFRAAADKTTDTEIGLLAPVAQQVWDLNLGGSKVTDAGLAPVAQLTNLRRLRLEKTAVTDAGLAHLKGLANLEYLNLYGTPVTDAGLANLEGLKNLKNLYLWQSQVTDAGVAKLKAALPDVTIDTGWKEPPAAPDPAAAPAAPAAP